MSGCTVFDTDAFVGRMTEAGFTEKQAWAIVDLQVAMLNANLATKVGIERIRARIAVAKADVFKWMMGLALVTQASLIVALVKLLE